MSAIRLSRPWSHPAVLAELLGRPVAGDAGEVVLDLAEAERARVDFCMRVLGFEPRETATGRAFVVLGDGAGPGPALRDPALAAEMVAEIAALHGRWEVAEARAGLRAMLPRALARMRAKAETTPADLRAGDGRLEAESLGMRRPYVGFFALEEHRLRHRRFDGGLSEELVRTVLVSGDAVTVLPYDPRRDRVLLIEQFRPGPFARRDPLPWCLETIAGRCDVPESLEATARREAEEEAGLALGRLERITAYHTSPGLATEHITAFVGEADLSGGEGVFGAAEEHEDIRTLVLERAAAMAAVASGEVNNAPLLVSLLWLELHAGRLREAWGSPG